MNQRNMRQRLEEELDRLQDRLEEEGPPSETNGAVGAGELSTLDQHPADLATDTFERSKEQSIREQIPARIKDVQDALRRLEEDTYGRCEICGRPISSERLEALPAARYCVEDQKSVEREAAADRAEASPGPIAAAS